MLTQMRTMLCGLLFSACRLTSYTEDDNPADTSCAVTLDRMNYARDTSLEKPVYIVLCDFSSSVDSQSLRHIQEGALEILERYYNKADIKFYPITSASRRPIYAHEGTQINRMKLYVTDEKKFSRCVDSAKAKDMAELKDALKHELHHRSKETFIIQSVQNAADVIKIADPENKNEDVIFILSDMLECGESAFGKINLEDGDLTQDAALLKSAQIISPQIAANIEIRAAYFNGGTYVKADICDFWNLVFTRLGYNRRVEISSEIYLHR